MAQSGRYCVPGRFGIAVVRFSEKTLYPTATGRPMTTANSDMTAPPDPDHKTHLRIGVRALAEQVLRSGDLEAGFFGSGRALEGIRAHQKVQRMRPPEYRAEVPVALAISTDCFVLTVSGRMDGVLVGDDRTLVEEIKTTSRSLENLVPSPLHWGQARAYAYLFTCQEPAPAVTVRLTYVHLDTGEVRQFEEHPGPAALEGFFNDLVARYLAWAGVLAGWKERRRAAIEALNFPYAGFRPGQREMAVAVYRAVTGRDRLMVQAATGIGKTMAAIFPAVKAMAGEGADRIFYLTARTTGRLAAEKAFEVLGDGGLRFKVLTLTAKERVCFTPNAACHPEECPFARGYYDRLPGAVRELFAQDAMTRSALETVARDRRICPFEFSLEMALWADAIVCDYNYAFDPRVYLRRFFCEDGGDHVFLVDEAHNLVDRSREMFSAEIRKQAFLDVRRQIRDALPGIYRLLGKINTRLLKDAKACETAGGWHWEDRVPDGLIPLLRRFLFAVEAWLVKNLRTEFRQGLMDLYFGVLGFVRVSERYDRAYATCYCREGKDLRVKLFCMDPAGQMAEALSRCRSAVFFSATLTPFSYYGNLLGCGAGARSVCLPSPFPEKNLALLVMGGISTLYRQRRHTAPGVCRALAALATGRPGNYLFFFPSYAYLEMIHPAFCTLCPGVETVVQQPSMSEAEKEAFLSCFSPENTGTVTGFAVMGGIFGEGIDLAGDRLSGAAIVGVGLPGITPEQELVKTYFDDRSEDGFAYAYQYPGWTRVLQAAGRVIRSDKDRGVVLLMDQRFATGRYRQLFPRTWSPRHVKDCHHLKQSLAGFWSWVDMAPW